jgi:hypothetical protein
VTTLNEWLGNSDFQPTHENAPNTIEIVGSLRQKMEALIMSSAAQKVEYGVAIGATDEDVPEFLFSQDIGGGTAHVNLPLGSVQGFPIGTFHTHPDDSTGGPSGGHSDADINFVLGQQACLISLVANISPSGQVKNYLLVRTPNFVQGDVEDDYNRIFGRKLNKQRDQLRQALIERLGSDTLSDGSQPGVTDGMLVTAQAHTLKSLSKRRGLIFYYGSTQDAYVLSKVN